MGQKINALLFRLPVDESRRKARWVANKKNFPKLLAEDVQIRQFITERLKYSVTEPIIERASDGRVRLTIPTARPGMVIGRKGQDLEILKAALEKLIKRDVLIDIQEIKNPDVVAELVAENIALQLERRIPFRRAMKKSLESAMAAGNVEGIRVRCSGRLGGAEIARTEEYKKGRVPLHTIRANIDYGFRESRTTYGIIGVKCWICKKEEDSNKLRR